MKLKQWWRMWEMHNDLERKLETLVAEFDVVLQEALVMVAAKSMFSFLFLISFHYTYNQQPLFIFFSSLIQYSLQMALDHLH
jgi:hypothetical protein